ncbi:CopG family transcriptional regulator [Rhodoplanes elegans]|uniref:CopG family transcriptional regulator n=1 Tax=Rhodoplanes elegans TaxID=29408 RepID=A0A327KEV6_9BRAD|nr:ribbon-helix-helix protein, CopG family [Rhodoplanes elegans]MBK5961632.1 CopG family transcriptional regulator [Rhodoplanes elegans]RAI36065.1 CopG family transcriptional regulator [Rhodoplanes elegans]
MPNPPAASLSLDKETETRLLHLAEARRQSTDTLVREAIEQYVDREERRHRLRLDALAAWTEYRATGQHVTADEADLWLARLEAGEDTEPPLPHA